MFITEILNTNPYTMAKSLTVKEANVIDDEPYPNVDDEWNDLDKEYEDFLYDRPLVKRIQRHRKNPQHKMLGSGSFAYVGTDDDDNFGDVQRFKFFSV